MTPEQKKAALAAYRERKPQIGVFALRGPNGVWVGTSNDLEKAPNRQFFTLEQGTHPHKALQAAYVAAGQGGFEFEALHILPQDTDAHARPRLLAEAQDLWCAKLSAHRV